MVHFVVHTVKGRSCQDSQKLTVLVFKCTLGMLIVAKACSRILQLLLHVQRSDSHSSSTCTTEGIKGIPARKKQHSLRNYSVIRGTTLLFTLNNQQKCLRRHRRCNNQYYFFFCFSNCINLDITTMIALVSSLTNGSCGYVFKVHFKCSC